MDTLTVDPPQAPATLAADEIRLSTGVIARISRTNALHYHRADMLVQRAGFDKHGFSLVLHVRFRALLAVSHLDGVRMPWPRAKQRDMEEFLARFSSGDADLICQRYIALNETLAALPPSPTTPPPGRAL